MTLIVGHWQLAVGFWLLSVKVASCAAHFVFPLWVAVSTARLIASPICSLSLIRIYKMQLPTRHLATGTRTKLIFCKELKFPYITPQFSKRFLANSQSPKALLKFIPHKRFHCLVFSKAKFVVCIRCCVVAIFGALPELPFIAAREHSAVLL